MKKNSRKISATQEDFKVYAIKEQEKSQVSYYNLVPIN